MSLAPLSPGRGLRAVVAALALSVSLAAWAQVPRAASASTSLMSSADDATRWQNLRPAQRDALAPLEKEWPSIDPARRQKWLVLAARFPSLPAAERTRIQGRMSDWAALSPAERGQARMRFQEAKQLPAIDRQQRWKAYQELPPEQKQQLAERAAGVASAPDVARKDTSSAARSSAKGANDSNQVKANVVPNPALSAPPRPIAPTVLQARPGATTTLMSKSPSPPSHQQTGMPKIAATPEFVNKSTLLPRRGPQAAGVGLAAAPASAPR